MVDTACVGQKNRIIGKLRWKYWVRTHKFGVNIPKSVQEAKEFNKENGNTLWCDAIYQEEHKTRF